jgi:hypothetical protein
MTSAVFLPPGLLDQSFPRDEQELHEGAECLGGLCRALDESKVVLIVSPESAALVSQLEWGQRSAEAMTTLTTIYKLLSLLHGGRANNCIRIDLSGVDGFVLHPVPTGPAGVLVDAWSAEAGRLLFVHDAVAASGEYFIGLACARNFCATCMSAYPDTTVGRRFPIVGLGDVDQQLGDAYEWVTLPNAHNASVGVAEIRANFRAIGAVRRDNQDGDSHWKLHFPDGRTWTCDENWGDRIGRNILDELKGYTGMPLLAIISALVSGETPERVFRLRHLMMDNPARG